LADHYADDATGFVALPFGPMPIAFKSSEFNQPDTLGLLLTATL
jgi:hypothetical protein